MVDTGIGFPPGMSTRIFDRFFQVDTAGTRRYGGTGIGLALATELVELQGGSILGGGRARRRRDAQRTAREGASAPSDPDALVRRMQRMFQTADAGVHRIATTVDLMMRYSHGG